MTGAEVSATSLGEQLEAHRVEYDLVSLAGVVLKNGDILERAAVGLRRKSEPQPVTVDDLWHLGSVTKAMTATMIARLVERGLLDWNSTLFELLPSLAEQMNREYRVVTLELLLTHRAGLPDNFSIWSAFRRPAIDGELPELRLRAVAEILETEPENEPGQGYRYSNVGYTLAAVIAEQATGLSWEALMQQELFQPLGMETAGFGAPAKAAQPWGHQGLFGLMKREVAPGLWADNNAVMGPAGAVHASLRDWARFADAHLQGPAGLSPLLRAETFKRLQRPALEGYAYGWVVAEEPELAGNGGILWHNGSNTMWYALMLLFPEAQTAFLLASNDGDMESADAAMRAVAKGLAARYLGPDEVDFTPP